LSKKLKKKIEEICGLNTLDWEARQARAERILASPEWKQSICNDLIGLSFRELERTLTGVASERQKKEESYEHKLKAYQTGRANKQPKPLRRDSSGTANSDRQGSHRSRTLKEILAQVHAPRVVFTPWDAEERARFYSFRTAKSSDEIQQDSLDGDDSTEE